MKKIVSIELKNFRAFYDSYDVIYLPKGENLLIYGENGSGKSSFALALDHFFHSSINPDFQFVRNQYAAQNSNGTIQLGFSDYDKKKESIIKNTNQTLYFGDITATHSEQFVQLANFVKGVLSYKNLVNIYLTNNPQLNLFPILVSDILGNHTEIGAKQTWKERWAKFSDLSKLDQRKRETKILKKEYAEFLKSFYNYINLNLTPGTNDLLDRYFNNKVTISFDNTDFTSIGDPIIPLTIKLNEITLDEPFEYLNEARLTAFAICMFLISIKNNPNAVDFKLLVLDDIFIGLDTSNRLPLLKIIKNEFPDHQIFITTYDRVWFYLAKTYLGNKWLAMEMYYEEKTLNHPITNSVVQCEVPVIIFQSPSNISRVKEYFKAKDYAASANYLRKEIENILKTKIPVEWNTTQIPNGGSTEVTKLDTLMQNCIKFFEDCGEPFPQDVKDKFSIFKKALLNPMSHDDVKSPIYRSELEEAIKLIDDFETIPVIKRKVLVPVRTHLAYTNLTHNYSVEIELIDNLFIIQNNNVKKIKKCKCIIKTWTFHGVEYSNCNPANNLPLTPTEVQKLCNKELTIEAVCGKIANSLRLQNGSISQYDFISKGETLLNSFNNFQFE